MTIDEATPGYGQPGCRGYEPPLRRDETMTTPDEARKLAAYLDIAGKPHAAEKLTLGSAGAEAAVHQLRDLAAQVERLQAKAAECDARRARLRTLLRELRAPIKCSIFGMPADEVTKWIARIDTALVESEAK